MSLQYWWSEPLRRWAANVRVQYEVERYVTPIARRAPGDWFQHDSALCVHLDELHYADFSDTQEGIDVRLQRSFSWAIQMISELRPPNWQEQLVGWVEKLNQRPLHELFLMGWNHETAPTPEKVPHTLPGHVAWMHISRSSNLSDAETEDMKHTVSEVLEAYAPNRLGGWIETENSLSAVLFLSTEDGGDTRATNLMSFGEDSGSLHDMLNELIEMVAADALVSCELAVGARVDSMQSLFFGAATAVAAWRERDFMPRTAKVSVWAEQPVAHLMSALSDEACRTFVHAASVRSKDGDLTLAPDLIEALNGVVAANLNVSEAARLLFLHRNTLINRIERIKHETGYDIRNFTDAFTLWAIGSIQKRLKGQSDG